VLWTVDSQDWNGATVLANRGLCAGRIVFTPQDVPFGAQVFHAVAVRP
jgi:hypothetical protein